MSDVFGKSKDGGGQYVKKNWFKLKDGEQVFRILPALGGNADDGIWSVFWNVHYGYKNTKGQLRTFQSSLVKNRKTKMVEVPDAACERIDSFKAKFEAAKKSGDSVTAAKLDKFVGQKGMYNLDSNHYMNVMDLQGNIGVLKIRHRCKVALEATIKRLRDEEGVDPRDPSNGRFLVFRRSGMGLDTTFQVDVLQDSVMAEVNGKTKSVKEDRVSVLTPEIAARCAKQVNGKWVYLEAGDLANLYKCPTAEQIARIVKESDVSTGNSPAVDEILDAKTGTQSASVVEPEEFDDSGDYAEETAPTAIVQAPPAHQAVFVQPTKPVEAPVAKVAEQKPAPKEEVLTASELTETDFLRSLGLAQ